jgi:acetolactate synthase I/II/III large subunit
MDGASFIAKAIKEYGVDHVFYVESILRHSIVKMQSLGITPILAHSEKAAAYMADGYARARRGPGICMAQSVGAANLAAGLQDAYLGHSPVLALTGRKPPMSQQRNAYQEIQHAPLFDVVTKFNASVEIANQLPNLVRQAFREITSGSPRPAHLDLVGHQGQITEKETIDSNTDIQKDFSRCPSVRMEADPDLVKTAAQMLVKAKKPVIVAGTGSIISSAAQEITELAEILSIPVATSVGGKGTILETHPLSIGVVGSYSRWCANRTVAEADLVLFIGCGAGDQVTNNWNVPLADTEIIQIDIDPVELGRNYPKTYGIAGDAKLTVKQINRFINTESKQTEWSHHAETYVRQWQSEVEPFATSNAVPMRPERLIAELTRVIPNDGAFVTDTGHSAIWSATLLTVKHMAQRFIRCAGSLGWAFPASLGVKCALPDQKVICFTGDGGFYYHFPELETARRYNIKTVTVVNNNSGFGQCLDQFGAQPGSNGDMFKFSHLNFAKIAQDMGCLGIRVEAPEELYGALCKALGSDLPVVVDVVTDILAAPTPPWKSGIKS